MFKFISIFLLTLTLVGCGGYKTHAVLEEKESFLSFNVGAKGSEFRVNNSSWYKITKVGASELYPISSGKIHLQVRKSGQLLVDRMLLINDGAIKKIKVLTND